MGRVLFSLAVIEQDFLMSIAVLSSIPSWRVLEGLGEEDFAVGDFDAVVEVLGLGEGEVGLGVGRSGNGCGGRNRRSGRGRNARARRPPQEEGKKEYKNRNYCDPHV